MFAIAGTNHFAITIKPRESERINEYFKRNGILGRTKFIIESSDTALSFENMEIPRTLDFIFIDGAHRFPFSAIDWHYTQGRLRIGGILGIDDIDIPSVRILHDFLVCEDEWELIRILGKTSFFRKVGTADISLVSVPKV